MKHILLFLLMLSAPCLAQVPLTGAGKSTSGGGGGGYTGPLDCSGCNTTPIALYTLFAPSAAKRGQKVIQVCDTTGGTENGACVDILTDATTGIPVPQSGVGTNGVSCPGTNCTIKTWYDVSGNTNCSGGVACDLQDPTASTRPQFAPNCIGTLPCASFSGSMTLPNLNAYAAQAQPFVISMVYKRTAVPGGYLDIFEDVTAGTGFLSPPTSNNILLYVGAGTTTSVSTAATEGSFHGINGMADNANSCGGGGSFISVNAPTSVTSVNVMSSSGWSSGNTVMGSNARGSPTMQIGELGFWGSCFSSAQSTAENTNQQARWGF